MTVAARAQGVRLAIGALALGLSACGSSVVWHGVSRDHRHALMIEQRGRAQTLYVDGRALRRHRAIAPASVVAESVDQLAYAARDGKSWYVFHPQGRSGAWDGIGQVVLHPETGRVAFAAERDGAWYVQVDTTQLGPFDALLDDPGLAWTESGLLFGARRGASWRVVHDGVEGPAFSSLGQLQASEEGPVYVGLTEQGAHVVIGHDLGVGYPWVQEVAVAGSRVAYSAGDLQRISLFIDRQRRVHDAEELGDLRLSPDHAAVLVRRGGREQVWVDGELGPEFEEIIPGSLSLTPHGAVGYAARADGRTLVVIDGARRAELDHLDALLTRDEAWAWLGRRDGAWWVHLPDRDLRFTSRRPRDLRWSASGAWAFVLASMDGDVIVTSRGQSPPFESVVPGSLALGPRTGRTAALVRVDGAYRLMVEGQPLEPPDALFDSLLFASDGLAELDPRVSAWMRTRADADRGRP